MPEAYQIPDGVIQMDLGPIWLHKTSKRPLFDTLINWHELIKVQVIDNIINIIDKHYWWTNWWIWLNIMGNIIDEYVKNNK